MTVPPALLDAIHKLSRGATKITTLHPTSVLEIACPRRRLAQCQQEKRQFLTRLFGELGALYFTPFDRDADTDSALAGAVCVPISSNTWLFTDAESFDHVTESVLYMGNWVLYCKDAPLRDSDFLATNIFDPADLEAVVRRCVVSVMILSFADNDPWLLAGHDI